MTVTSGVVLVALVAALLAFAVSAVRARPLSDEAAVDAVVADVTRTRQLRRVFHRFLRQRLDRRTAGGLVLTVALLGSFTVAMVVGVILDMVDGSYGLASLDGVVAHWGVENADPVNVEVLKVITQFGSTVVVLLALLIAASVDFLRHRHAEIFLFAAIVIGGEKLIANGVKAVVQRERPDVLQLVPWDGSSFPSGHAASAAVVWPAVALLLGRGCSRLIRALLAGTAALITFAVAASRALLGVHWLTDVLAGLAIGCGWFFLCAVVFGGRAQRRGDSFVARPRRSRASSVSGASHRPGQEI